MDMVEYAHSVPDVYFVPVDIKGRTMSAIF